jgi:pimeloyl-ACP methyl ester carboxylesterase
MHSLVMSSMKTSQQSAAGLSIRFAETAGSGDQTTLLVNPWPESLFAWDTIWEGLSRTGRLVAIDLPGFGQSEGRPELYSPRAMGSFLLTLIDEWGLGSPHLVGSDVGQGAVLFALSEDPQRFPSAVVGSGGAAVPLDVTGALKDIIEAPDMSAFEAIDGRDVVAQTLQGIQSHTLPDEIVEDYKTSYAGKRFVDSAAYVRAYPEDLPVLGERLGNIKTPVQIISGRNDILVPPSNAEYLHERLSDSRLDLLDTGHFAWEDGADEYLRLASSWIESHRTAGSA